MSIAAYPHAGRSPDDLDAAQLAEAIAFHNQRYYAEDAPLIPDAEYDRLVDRLGRLDPGHPLLQQVGTQSATAGDKVAHAKPMLSLEKCTTAEEFSAWFKGLCAAASGRSSSARLTAEEVSAWAALPEAALVMTPKIDGLACTLRYKAGRLAQAATRGDGRVGEDVTHNAAQIPTIPARLRTSLADDLEVRGEIYLSLSAFAAVAEQYANPRNLAAGTLKAKDNPAIPPAQLSFFAYDVLGGGELSKSAKLARAAAEGFVPAPAVLLRGDLAAAAFAQATLDKAQWDYETDGMVFELDDVELSGRLGITAHHPRGAVAWKFVADAGLSQLVEVEWSVARTGTITPVAIVQPVVLSGATVTRATLHNVSNLLRLQLRIGDQVELVRRGGVIPHVERVVVAADAPPILPPEQCPSCGAPTRLDVRTDRTRQVQVLLCSRPEQCTVARQRTVLHYCQTLELEGFGDKVVDLLMDRGLVTDPADLYTLQPGDLLALPRFGETMVANLLAQVRKARQVPLANFLCALGIPSLGKQTAALLVSRGDLAAVRALNAAEIAGLHSLGDKTGQQIAAGLAERAPLIDRLLHHVEVRGDDLDGAGQGPLSGWVVVFTGALEHMGRRDAQQQVVKKGGLAGDSVTAETTHLVVGGDELDSPTPSSKLKKARKLAEQGSPIQIMSESEFWSAVESA